MLRLCQNIRYSSGTTTCTLRYHQPYWLTSGFSMPNTDHLAVMSRIAVYARLSRENGTDIAESSHRSVVARRIRKARSCASRSGNDCLHLSNEPFPVSCEPWRGSCIASLRICAGAQQSPWSLRSAQFHTPEGDGQMSVNRVVFTDYSLGGCRFSLTTTSARLIGRVQFGSYQYWAGGRRRGEDQS